MWSPTDTYAIARIELPGSGTYGWQVRLQRRGRKFGRFFADGKFGGRRPSYGVAREWRDSLLEELREELEGPRSCRRSARNSSGVVGVSKVSVTAASGEVYRFWQASWSPGRGERRCVKFSIRRHGERGAFRLAVEARREGLSI